MFHQVLLSTVNKFNTAPAAFPNGATSILILPYCEDKTVGLFSSGLKVRQPLSESIVKKSSEHEARAVTREGRQSTVASGRQNFIGKCRELSTPVQRFTPTGTFIQHLSLQTDIFLVREMLGKSWRVKTDRRHSSSILNQWDYLGHSFAFLQPGSSLVQINIC